VVVVLAADAGSCIYSAKAASEERQHRSSRQLAKSRRAGAGTPGHAHWSRQHHASTRIVEIWSLDGCGQTNKQKKKATSLLEKKSNGKQKEAKKHRQKVGVKWQNTKIASSLLETRSFKGPIALDKGFKEQTAKPHPAKGSLPSAVCRALGKENWPSAVDGVFAECRVRKALDKAFPFFFEKSFAECLPDPALGKEFFF